MTLRKQTLALIIAAALIVGALTGFGVMQITKQAGGSGGSSLFGNTVQVDADEYENLQYMADKYQKAEELWQIIKKDYYTDIDDEDLYTGMYKGIFEGTGDQYSNYFTEKEYEEWQSSLSGEFDGIGVTYHENEKGEYEIISTFKGSPAEKAGMQKGDIITKVDGKEYDTTDLLSTHIRGKAGTDVKITYMRNGKEKTVTITRARIKMTTVESEAMDGNIGYIKINSFEKNTATEFKDALTDMEDKKVKGLIIDLRDNGGGLVNSSTEIVDMLIDKGTIMYTEDNKGKKEYTYSTDGRTDLPYVVLVNENSASASEIMTAAIKENKGGKIVGTKTFGKGIIQQSSELKDGTGYKLTILQYFSPNGNKIHGEGIEPDIKVQGEEEQLEKAVELLK